MAKYRLLPLILSVSNMKLLMIFLATCIVAHAADSLSPLKKVPQNVTELWAGYDPQKEPLQTEVVREWEEFTRRVAHARRWATGQLNFGEIPCLSRVRCLVSELGRQADGRIQTR